MSGVFKSFPFAFRMIFKDPVNFFLAIVPTLIALILYCTSVVLIYKNLDWVSSLFKDYVYTADYADLLAKILAAILIIFIFFIMSWTFIIVVGIIAAPFNSLLSSRIEKQLTSHIVLSEDQQKAIEEMKLSIWQTIKNEFKKLFFILILGGVAFLLNLFPLFCPVGIFLFALLLSIQFIDYSWSRHEMKFGSCFGDTLKNIFAYSFSGFLFMLLIAIPVVNAFIPALATSYYTVLWLHRHQKIDLLTEK